MFKNMMLLIYKKKENHMSKSTFAEASGQRLNNKWFSVHLYQELCKYTLENTEGTIKNGQSRETVNKR